MTKKVRLIDMIMSEVLDKNILDEVRYICLNSAGLEELLQDYEEEFEAEYFEVGRKPNKKEVESHFGKKIVIDESISKNQKYILLTKT